MRRLTIPTVVTATVTTVPTITDIAMDDGTTDTVTNTDVNETEMAAPPDGLTGIKNTHPCFSRINKSSLDKLRFIWYNH